MCQDFPYSFIYFLNNYVKELLLFEDKDIFFLKGNIVLYRLTCMSFVPLLIHFLFKEMTFFFKHDSLNFKISSIDFENVLSYQCHSGSEEYSVENVYHINLIVRRFSFLNDAFSASFPGDNWERESKFPR